MKLADHGRFAYSAINDRPDFTWPGGLSGAGRFEFVIGTDSATEIFESNAQDTAESNNTARITATSAPDLVVQNLRVQPGGGATQARAGGMVTVSWNDVNLGLSATPASWNDRLVVTNMDTGETLLDIALPYDIALAGNATHAVRCLHPEQDPVQERLA